MKLVNLINGIAYPMARTGHYRKLCRAVTLESRKTTVEWIVQAFVKESILPRALEISVVEASKADRKLLAKKATLTILFDDDLALEKAPLLRKHGPLTLNAKRHQYSAMEDGESKGVFLVNGTVVRAIIQLPRKPIGKPQIMIDLPAWLYETVSESSK